MIELQRNLVKVSTNQTRVQQLTIRSIKYLFWKVLHMIKIIVGLYPRMPAVM